MTIAPRNQEVQEIKNKITEKFIEGKQKLGKKIARFEELRV